VIYGHSQGEKMETKQQGTVSAGSGPAVRSPSYLSSGLQIHGEISGNEDLHIDGNVEGSISVGGFRLTVGRGARVKGEAVARELVVYGNVKGDLRGRDLVEVKNDGAVEGDIVTSRIMIEDGAFLKGNIEIDRTNSKVGTDLDTMLSRGAGKSA
jgi:cytoskeletal protein CcmA (bactofilin family)